MLHWDSLLDETALAAVVPDEYARFRRPLGGALAVFLEGLPAARQAAILAEQAALPANAGAAERLALLARGSPALHKLGQVLARDHRLCAELRRHLQELESLPPSVPIDTIHGILAHELGPLDRLGVRLASAALAEASVAVVIPFEDDRGRHGVFKVLKPGVVERLEEELNLFERIGSYLDEKCDEFQIPHLDYRESFEQVRDKLRHEVRFDFEQRHLALARAVYAGEPRIQVPALFDHCTPRVTAMERVSGGKITEHRLGCAWERRRLAHLLGEALVARPFFSRSGRALFHADPHAGNLFLTADGRLALLDWSLVGWLGEPERVAVVQVLLAAATLQSERVATLLSTLADHGRIDRPVLDAVAHRWVAQVRRGRFPGFTWLIGLLDEAVQMAGVRLGADLMLFRKALHTLEGVAADVGAGVDSLDEVLLGEFLGHLAVEWPQRWLVPPTSRAFATRLSNADLTGFLLHLPCAMTRCWLEQCRLPAAAS